MDRSRTRDRDCVSGQERVAIGPVAAPDAAAVDCPGRCLLPLSLRLFADAAPGPVAVLQRRPSGARKRAPAQSFPGGATLSSRERDCPSRKRPRQPAAPAEILSLRVSPWIAPLDVDRIVAQNGRATQDNIKDGTSRRRGEFVVLLYFHPNRQISKRFTNGSYVMKSAWWTIHASVVRATMAPSPACVAMMWVTASGRPHSIASETPVNG